MQVLVAGGCGVVGRHLAAPLAKATSETGWRLRYPSWRQGFEEGLA
jgi:nucleoside-diphosphate-sugar epimerase